MTGVSRSLNIREGCPSIRQKKRGQASNQNKAIQEEVAKLVEAQIVRETHRPEQIMSQNYYPLLEIDWKIESLCTYHFKCFLDAYKGYHQIQMVEGDKEKTVFHTSQGVYCYTKMPFGLKNARATYHRLVDKAFEKKFGSLCRRLGDKEPYGTRNPPRYRGNFPNLEKDKHETESQEVYIWSGRRNVSR
ncbi:hypothetical protein Tco_0979208 [Tanacetum coccineum]